MCMCEGFFLVPWQNKLANGNADVTAVMQHSQQGKDQTGSHWEAFTMQSPRCSSCSGGHRQLANHKKSYKEAVVLLRYAGAHDVTVMIKPFLQSTSHNMSPSCVSGYAHQLQGDMSLTVLLHYQCYLVLGHSKQTSQWNG